MGKVKLFIYLLIIVFSPSILYVSMGIGSWFLYVFIFLLYFISERNWDEYPSVFWKFTLILSITTFLYFCYWTDFKMLFYGLFLWVAFILWSKITRKDLHNLTHTLSAIMVLLIVGAWIGLMIKLLGLDPLGSISNLDGRPNYFYYTTFSNIDLPRFIRPSGIYDEPGSFSFFICFTITLREMLRFDRKITMFLLFGGLVTFSFAHLIFASMFVLLNRPLRIPIVVLLLLLLFTTVSGDAFNYVNDYLLVRAKNPTSDGRVNLFFRAYEVITSDPKIVLFGASPSCVYNLEECKENFGYFSENPLGPMASIGLLGSWPYYIFIGSLLLSPLISFNKFKLFFPLGLLFIQRPYVMYHSYSFVAVFIFINLMYAKTFNYYRS